MRPLYEEFDGFDFDDTLAVKRLMREQRREEERLAKRRSGRSHESLNRFDDLESDGEFDAFDDFEDYDEDEFDSYSDLSTDH